MASEVSPNWLQACPHARARSAGRQPGRFFLSFFAAMAFTPVSRAGTKKPGLWPDAKRPGLPRTAF